MNPSEDPPGDLQSDPSQIGKPDASDRSSPGGCPSEDQLVLIAAGRVRDPALLAHTGACGACRTLLAQIRDDAGFVSDLLAVLGGSGSRSADGPRDRTSGPPPAILVPGYQIVRELRRGGQGVVYAAVQDDTKRTVALKMLLSGNLASARERFRFEREIEIAASLRHPNIVTLFEGVESSDGRRGYAMELIDGEPIDAWAGIPNAAKPPAKTLRQRLVVLARVCRAVQYAHARGVIHRDLKPGNILVGADDEPHVLDFGLAKRFTAVLDADAVTEMAMTRQGMFEGTPAYASPEQVDGRGPDDVDARSDLYSLAVIAYRLVTGRFPYPAEGSPREVFNAICTTEPASPQAAAREARLDHVPSDLETILLKALSKDRERRYQTAEAFAADLDNFLGGEVIDAKRDSTMYVIRKSVWKHRKLIGFACVVLVSLGLGLAFAGFGLAEARNSKLRQKQESDRADAEEAKREAVAGILDQLMPPGEGGGNLKGLDILYRKVDSGIFAEQPGVEALVRAILGDIYRDRGARPMAEVQKTYAAAHAIKTYGEHDVRTAEALNDLAETALSANHVQHARIAAERALAIGIRISRPDDAETELSRDILARVLLRQGDSRGANLLIDRPHNVLISGAAGVARRARAELTRAQIHLAVGEYEGALVHATESLRLRFDTMSNEHRDLPGAMRTMADALRGLGRGDEEDGWANLAEGLRASVITRTPETWTTLISAQHRILRDPGSLRLAQTRLSFAISSSSGHLAFDELRRAIPVLEAKLGAKHPAVGEGYILLSGYYRGFGRYEEAVICGRRCFEISREAFSTDAPLVNVLAHYSYGGALAIADRPDEAREIFSAGLDIALRTIGDSIATVRLLNQLAILDLSQERDAEGESFARRAMEMSGRVDPDHYEADHRCFTLACAQTLRRGDLDAERAVLDLVENAGWTEEPGSRVIRRLAAHFEAKGDPEAIATMRSVLVRIDKVAAARAANLAAYQALPEKPAEAGDAPLLPDPPPGFQAPAPR